MNPRYTALPLIAVVIKLLAWLVIVIAILGSLKFLFLGVEGWNFWKGHVVMAFWELVNGAIRGIVLLAVAEGVHVLLDIEENTRRAADAATGTITAPTPQA
jgi:hypothetical protein